MVFSTRVTQDRRRISRLPVLLDCRYTFEGKVYEGVIVNISLKGAFLSSEYMPPQGSTITVRLKSPSSGGDFPLEGTVVRGTWVSSGQGQRGRFGISFGNNTPELIKLFNTLNKKH